MHLRGYGDGRGDRWDRVGRVKVVDWANGGGRSFDGYLTRMAKVIVYYKEVAMSAYFMHVLQILYLRADFEILVKTERADARSRQYFGYHIENVL